MGGSHTTHPTPVPLKNGPNFLPGLRPIKSFSGAFGANWFRRKIFFGLSKNSALTGVGWTPPWTPPPTPLKEALPRPPPPPPFHAWRMPPSKGELIRTPAHLAHHLAHSLSLDGTHTPVLPCSLAVFRSPRGVTVCCGRACRASSTTSPRRCTRPARRTRRRTTSPSGRGLPWAFLRRFPPLGTGRKWCILCSRDSVQRSFGRCGTRCVLGA